MVIWDNDFNDSEEKTLEARAFVTKDAVEFFRMSAGKWRSQRATHHLPFRRAEVGASEIEVEALEANHPEVISVCQLHEVDPALAAGGCLVRWQGSMAWDRENEENHEGKTVFALVPDETSSPQGRLLRDRGYAEIVPVVGRYRMDDEGGLELLTDYESMSSVERFWFAGEGLRMRTSVVRRFGGFNTATFCVESPIGELEVSEGDAPTAAGSSSDAKGKELFSALGW